MLLASNTSCKQLSVPYDISYSFKVEEMCTYSSIFECNFFVRRFLRSMKEYIIGFDSSLEKSLN